MGVACGKSGKPGKQGSVDYEAVRADLLQVMDHPEWDDGSYAPFLIRLAWHSSGTYDKADGSGGSNGATMRHAMEAGDPENAGLDKARAFLEQIKQRHPSISYADLWILAAYVAIQHTDGPVIDFKGGRMDAPEERAVAPGRLPGAEAGLDDGFELDSEGRMKGWEKLTHHVRSEVFGRMGFNDKEIVALLCGGHVYGRCHTDRSGYNGAWVENPTLFSNEYAADMIGDKWVAVTHDTKMPDGGEVPEEVKPAVGKRQYIDLSKYEPDEEEQAAVSAPDAKDFPPGVYKCVSTWVNCRESPDTGSSIIGRLVQDQVVTLLAVKVFGTACRGRLERGGWVSIRASGGKTLFEPAENGSAGGFDLQALQGAWRAVTRDGVAVLTAGRSGAPGAGTLKPGQEFGVDEVVLDQGSLLGRLTGQGQMTGCFALLSSPSLGPVVELIVPNWNEKPRKPIAGQTGHQMMLVSDMVLLWDEGFKKHLEVYAEDEALLKEDFGTAFKRLTELGCPWSADRGPLSGQPNQKQKAMKGCPVKESL